VPAGIGKELRRCPNQNGCYYFKAGEPARSKTRSTDSQRPLPVHSTAENDAHANAGRRRRQMRALSAPLPHRRRRLAGAPPPRRTCAQPRAKIA